MFYAQHGRADDAVEHIDRVLKIQPTNEELLSRKALILWELGKELDALQFLHDTMRFVVNSTALADIERRIRWVQQLGMTANSIFLKKCLYLGVGKTETERVNALVSWVKAKGGAVDGLDFLYDEKSRLHIVASKMLVRDQLVLKIPLECVLHKDVELEYPALKVAQDKLGYANAFAFIMVAEKKNLKSRFKPLLDAVNFEMANFPLFYSKEERRLLDGTTVPCISYMHHAAK